MKLNEEVKNLQTVNKILKEEMEKLKPTQQVTTKQKEKKRPVDSAGEAYSLYLKGEN